MNKIFTIKTWFTALLSLGCTVMAAQPVVTDEAIKQAKELVAKMTLQEKIAYISGYTSFSLRAIPRLGIPEIRLADGPQGIRNHAPHSTLFPCGITIAATWDRQLALRYGESMGDDARARGVGILLGPGVNIYRAPMCGRNFEYFGEDPYLTGEIAAQYIRGVQSRGVIATIKHFCGNNQEWSRHHVSSNIDERTLHEIYFPAFRKAVQEAGVGAVMNSYNLLNGVHATENGWLNQTILRDTWGFKGLLMSDWTSVYSVVQAANNGLDLEMPKGRYFNEENLLPAIANGRVTEATIDLKVQHILQTLIGFGLFDRNQKLEDIPLDNPISRQTALDVARGGIVLLKNEADALPLHGRTAIVGENANIITTGGGSGFVNPFSVTPLTEAMKTMRRQTILLTDDVIYDDVASEVYTDESLTRKGFAMEFFKNQKMEGQSDSTVVVDELAFDWQYNAIGKGFPADHFSARGVFYYRSPSKGLLRISMGGDDGYRIFANDSLLTGDWGNHAYSNREVTFAVEAHKVYRFRMEYFDNISSAAVRCRVLRLNDQKLTQGLKKADNVVYCTGFNSHIEGEGFDRSYRLTTYQQYMINHLSTLNPNLTVVLNSGGSVEMESWLPKAKAVVMAWHTGQEGGQALAEVLTGKIAPSGKLPISIERRWEDNPCYQSYYQNTKAKEVRTVEYNEGIFVGYRGYDRSGIKPLYAFGHGLSYTSFSYSNLKVEQCDGQAVKVSFTVRNTGKRAAAEVTQLYVHAVNSKVMRPEKELKGFEKVYLKPGEQRNVEIMLSHDAFSYYDIDRHRFVVAPGDYEIRVGGASDKLVLKGSISL